MKGAHMIGLLVILWIVGSVLDWTLAALLGVQAGFHP